MAIVVLKWLLSGGEISIMNVYVLGSTNHEMVRMFRAIDVAVF